MNEAREAKVTRQGFCYPFIRKEVSTMNKAFVNENNEANLGGLPSATDLDAALDQELFGSLGTGIKKNYITKQGFADLQKSLQNLLQEERPPIADTINEPLSLDQESESYQAAQTRLEEIDRRVRFLQRRIDLAEVIDPESQSGNQVLFGATVTVLDEDNQTRVYKIVGVDEIDGKSGKVSWVSPIGRALLQSQIGDTVLLETPQGEEELEIQKIEFKPID
ncbi:MAG: GreA/GreB family elongation factor [Pseudobdellovibrionaceae bacterium]